MIIINFSHPLTEQHLAAIKELSGNEITQVIPVVVQFDNQLPFQGQLESLLQQIPLNTEELQTLPILVNLPSYNHIAALILSSLHGIMGHFPTIIRLRPLQGSMPTQYEVAELINLDNIREMNRLKRA